MNESASWTAALLVALIIVSAAKKSGLEPPPPASASWQTQYRATAQTGLYRYDQYIADDAPYQLSDPTIAAAAATLANQSRTAKEAMQAALTYTYQNVQYDANEPTWTCMTRSAPEVLRLQSGQCDTQSSVVIALLRKMGVAAVPVGGCVYPKPNCAPQALFGLDAPKYTPFTVLPGDLQWARRGGGLHSWVDAWDDQSRQWINLEATTGRLASTNCWTYHVEVFPENGDRTQFCVSTSKAYATACSRADLAGLNDNGLGLAGEVAP